MKIARTPLSDQVAEKLQAMIRAAEYQAGDRLPAEGELAEKFSVSRITVREAVRKLRAMGILEVRQGEGTFVKTLTPTSVMKPLISMLTLDKKNLGDIFEVRMLIECRAVELATQRADQESIEKLRAHLDQMDLCVINNDLSRYNEMDALFHCEILQCSGNQVMIAIGDVIVSMIRESISVGISPPNALANSVVFHKKIVDAIERKDAEDAVALMKQHLQGGANYVESM